MDGHWTLHKPQEFVFIRLLHMYHFSDLVFFSFFRALSLSLCPFYSISGTGERGQEGTFLGFVCLLACLPANLHRGEGRKGSRGGGTGAGAGTGTAAVLQRQHPGTKRRKRVVSLLGDYSI